MPDEEIKELAVKAVPKKSWKILLHAMIWRDWTSPQKPVTTNEWLQLTIVSFDLFRENHLPGMIRGTKSGRTSSGMDGQEGGILASSHVCKGELVTLTRNIFHRHSTRGIRFMRVCVSSNA